MSDTLQIMAFLAAAFGISLAAWHLLKSRSTTRRLGLIPALIVLVTPCLIAPHNVIFRAFACLLALELMFKMIDYARHANSNGNKNVVEYVKFLIPFPVLLVRLDQRIRQPTIDWSACVSIVFASLMFALAFVLVEMLSRIAAVRSSFLLDHALKFVVFIVAIESLSRAFNGIERLSGFEITPLIDNAFLSRTVGEFWVRFNTRVHSWFDQNIFRPFGGRRSPGRGIWLVFFVSAVLHELGFAIATSRVDGYQFTFFMLQAPAVIASRPLHRLAISGRLGTRIAIRIGTIVWMGITSIFFFHGVNRVFPFFYAAEPWLP